MTGRNRGGRGRAGRGRGNFQGRGNSGVMASFNQGRGNSGVVPSFNQGNVNVEASLESGQSSPHQAPFLEAGIPSPREGPIESQSSRIQRLNPSPEVETSGVGSCSNRKRGRGKYKSQTIDIKTKCGSKIAVNIPDDIDRAVGSGARDIVNYCGLIMRSTVSFRDGDWQENVLKYGEVMWLKDKFEISSGVRQHVFQAFVISTMQRFFRAWKARLSNHYSRYNTDAERLSHRPEDVELEDWKYLVEYFGSEDFMVISERNKKNRKKQITKHTCGTKSFAEVEESTRNTQTGEKDQPDKIWEIQHTSKNDEGELVWSDPKSQQVHVQLKELVTQQQSEDVENRMTPDEILTSVLGERAGYIRGKEYGKNPPKKSRAQQANLEASMSSAIEIVRQEMQAEMDQKLQEEREQMTAELKRNMEEELQRKLDEERIHMNLEADKRIQVEMDKKFQEQFATFMTRIQQGQCV